MSSVDQEKRNENIYFDIWFIYTTRNRNKKGKFTRKIKKRKWEEEKTKKGWKLKKQVSKQEERSKNKSEIKKKKMKINEEERKTQK